MTDVKILVVVNDVDAGNAYQQVLSDIGVACDLVRSFGEMSVVAVENTYNGILVDILTLVRCSKEEKVIAYDCINFFPVLRVKWEARYKKIKLSPLEQAFSPDTESALRFFIETRCKSFPARSLRRDKRKQINLNLLYCSDGAFSEQDTHRSFTVSLSKGGIFLYTMRHLKKGERVWLRFMEFADQSPIAATVCWSQKWGITRCIPGAGLRFDALTSDQEKDIQRILNL